MNVKTIKDNKFIKNEILKVQKLEINSIGKAKISNVLSKCCIDNKRILFNKLDLDYILGLNESNVDYIIDKYNLNTSKNKQKKNIFYSDFIKYFAVPYIFSECKSNKIEA
ncbi:MAG: hypothetical protein ACRCTP_14520 [Aeromonas popoffii]|uniref:hypothetical protein n=1 Tax=Aeromonas popoffii TaxID=70856 RepID=UPI003F3F9E5C